MIPGPKVTSQAGDGRYRLLLILVTLGTGKAWEKNEHLSFGGRLIGRAGMRDELLSGCFASR